MASDVGMTERLTYIGDEWAPREHTTEVIDDFILPYISDQSKVAEIGVGGGKHGYISQILASFSLVILSTTLQGA